MPSSAPSVPRSRDERGAVIAALLAAGLSVAGHVLGKAVRDTLYLSTFPVERLPLFVIATGVVSAFAVGAYTRLNTRFGPRRVVPALALLTAASLPPLWLAVRAGSPVAVAILFGWTTISGTFLTSGFWAVLGERFDPRRARKLFGWMGVATTVGGLAGGFGAHAALDIMGPEDLLMVLAVSSVALALAARRLGQPPDDAAGPAGRALPPTRGAGLSAGVREVLGTPYLRDIAILVTMGTVAAGVADYVLKDVASHALSSKRELGEFFSLFHGVVGAFTLGVQVLIARPIVHKKGIAAALAALPLWLAGGAAFAAAWPLLWVLAAFRGGEASVRNSFHRSGYELLFVPLSPGSKRVVKPVLDTLLERAADGLGAALVLLLVGALHFGPQRLTLVVLGLGAAELFVVLRVRRGYVTTLSANLVARAVELDEVADAVDHDPTARDVVRATLLDRRAEDLRKSVVATELGRSLMRSLNIAGASAKTAGPVAADPVVALVADLVSDDVETARAALERWDPRDRRPLPFVIALLARDELHREATRALASAPDRFAGALADTLDDLEEPFDLRRRVPRALAACSSPVAIDALTRALGDARFEVRYQAAAALEIIGAHAGKRPDAAAVWRAVRGEVGKSKAVLEAQRVLDADVGGPLAEVVERRGEHSLRHIFRLLGFVFDPKSIALSHRAVVGEDPHLRAVGLEYLENVLPDDVRRALWPVIGDAGEAPDAPPRSRSLERIVEDLVEQGALSRAPGRDVASSS